MILPLLLFILSCSVSTKNLNSNQETGFFFKTKSKYLKVSDENYQISIPKKANDNKELIVEIKPKGEKQIQKEISQDEYFKIQQILKSNINLTNENKKSIQEILKLNT